MAVRLYDKHGRVKPARFAREYQMYDCMDHGPEGVPLELDHNMSYSRKDKLYYFSVSAIYAPYLLRICHHNDTMELILPDSYLAFEKLVFHPGRYCFLEPYYSQKVVLTKRGNYQPVYTKLHDLDWDNARKKCDTFFRKRQQ